MGSFNTKFTYRQLLTIKHAVYYYLLRDDSTEADWDSEGALLEKVKEYIEQAEEKIKR